MLLLPTMWLLWCCISDGDNEADELAAVAVGDTSVVVAAAAVSGLRALMSLLIAVCLSSLSIADSRNISM